MLWLVLPLLSVLAAAGAPDPHKDGADVDLTSSLKIYIYDQMPYDHRLFDTTELWPAGPGTTNVGAFQRSERNLHRLMNMTNATNIVTDPKLADILYVPVYVWHKCPWDAGLYFGEPPMACFMDAYESSIQRIKDLGTWDDGHRHFFPALFDTGMCGLNCMRSTVGITYSNASEMVEQGSCFDLHERNTDVLHWPSKLMENAHVISYLGLKHGAYKHGECFREQDAVIPPPLNLEHDATALLYQVTAMPMPEELKNRSRGDRVYFRGSISALGHEHPLRKKLVSMFGNRSGYKLTGESAATQQTVWDILHSDFCLVPPAFVPWSFRLTETMMAGCIPVIVDTEEVMLPLSRGKLDWTKFAVLINSDEIGMLDHHVVNAASNIKEMRDALVNASKAMSMTGTHAWVALMDELGRAVSEAV